MDIDQEQGMVTEEQDIEKPIRSHTFRFLWNQLPCNTTDSSVRNELEQIGFKEEVQFINMKVSRSFLQQPAYMTNEESIPSFDRIYHNDNKLLYSCYIEIRYSLEEVHKLSILSLLHSTTVLYDDKNDSILPTANCGFEWYPDIMKSILSYFHSPPALLSQEHRSNSYNVLLSHIIHTKKCHFAAFKNHLYFTKWLVQIRADNLLLLSSILWRDNKEVMKIALQQKGSLLYYATENIKRDRQIAIIALKQNFESYAFISDSLKSDPEIVHCYWISKQVANMKEKVLYLADENIQGTKSIVLELVLLNPNNLQSASQKLKSDKDVVMAAVKLRGSCLTFADESLQNDIEFVTTALKNTDNVQELFNSLSDKMKNCKIVAQCAVQWSNQLFSSLSIEMRDDPDIVKLATSRDGRLFQYASENMKNNKEMAMLALTNYVDAFPSLPQQLRDDREVVMLVIEQNAALFKHASDGIKDDANLAFMAVTKFPLAFCDVSLRLKNDYSFVQAALHRQIQLFEYVGDDLKNNKDLVLSVIAVYPQGLQFASDYMKADKEVVTKAVELDGLLLKYASDDLKDDFDVVMAALSNNPKAREYIGTVSKSSKTILLYLLHADIESAAMSIPGHLRSDEEFTTAYRDCALQLVSQQGHFLGEIDSTFAKKETFIRAAVNQNPMSLEFVKGPLAEDFEFVYQTLERNGYAIQFVSKELLAYDDIIAVAKESILKQLTVFKPLNALANLPSVLLTDRDFVLQIVRTDGLQLANVLPKFKKDKEIIFAAIQSNAAALKFTPGQLKENITFVQEAACINPLILEYSTTQPLIYDYEFMLHMVLLNGYAIQFASSELQQNAELIQIAKERIIFQIPNTNIANRFDKLPFSFLKDKQFVLSVIEKDGLQLQYVPSEFKEDENLVMLAICSNRNALQFVSENLRERMENILAENESFAMTQTNNQFAF